MASLTVQVQELPAVKLAAKVVLEGSIDATTVLDFREQIETLLGSGRTRFVLDMEGVKYVNSTGLGELVKLADGLTGQGGAVCLTRLHPKVKVVFDMLGLNAFFQIFPDVASAERFLINDEEQSGGAVPTRPVSSPMSPAAGPISDARPKEFNCDGCATKLKIGKPGTYKCPKCFLIFVVSSEGEVSYPSDKGKSALQLNLQCSDECVEALLAFSQAIAKKIGFSREMITEIQAGIYDALKNTRLKAYGDDGAKNISITVTPEDNIFTIKLVDHGKLIDPDANGSYAQAKACMDAFEHRRGPQGGNVVTMTKKLP